MLEVQFCPPADSPRWDPGPDGAECAHEANSHGHEGGKPTAEDCPHKECMRGVLLATENIFTFVFVIEFFCRVRAFGLAYYTSSLLPRRQTGLRGYEALITNRLPL